MITRWEFKVDVTHDETIICMYMKNLNSLPSINDILSYLKVDLCIFKAQNVEKREREGEKQHSKNKI